MLKVVAERLTESIRSVDTASRLGGDEVVVVLVGLDCVDAAAAVADKLVKMLAEPISYNGTPVNIGSSIGVAVYPDHAATAPETLQRADQAM